MERLNDIEERVERASSGYRLSLENVLQMGFNRFRSAPGAFIIYSLIAAVALSNPVSGLLLGGPVITGYYVVIHRLGRGERVDLNHFFISFDKFLPLLILTLLVAVVIFLGLILLVIPGLYFAVSYLFVHFFVWFYDQNPTEAARLSRKLVSGNFTAILGLALTLTAMNVLGALAFGVGLLLTLPFSYCVLYSAFDDIIGIP